MRWAPTKVRLAHGRRCGWGLEPGLAVPSPPLPLAAGPGYNLNGLNGASMNASQVEAETEVMKSQAGGTSTLDAFLARAYYGFQVQNFFTFARNRCGGGRCGHAGFRVVAFRCLLLDLPCLKPAHFPRMPMCQSVLAETTGCHTPRSPREGKPTRRGCR
jgi:hypothetical protein